MASVVLCSDLLPTEAILNELSGLNIHQLQTLIHSIALLPKAQRRPLLSFLLPQLCQQWLQAVGEKAASSVSGLGGNAVATKLYLLIRGLWSLAPAACRSQVRYMRLPSSAELHPLAAPLYHHFTPPAQHSLSGIGGWLCALSMSLAIAIALASLIAVFGFGMMMPTHVLPIIFGLFIAGMVIGALSRGINTLHQCWWHRQQCHDPWAQKILFNQSDIPIETGCADIISDVELPASYAAWLARLNAVANARAPDLATVTMTHPQMVDYHLGDNSYRMRLRHCCGRYVAFITGGGAWPEVHTAPDCAGLQQTLQGVIESQKQRAVDDEAISCSAFYLPAHHMDPLVPTTPSTKTTHTYGAITPFFSPTQKTLPSLMANQLRHAVNDFERRSQQLFESKPDTVLNAAYAFHCNGKCLRVTLRRRLQSAYPYALDLTEVNQGMLTRNYLEALGAGQIYDAIQPVLVNRNIVDSNLASSKVSCCGFTVCTL